MFELKAKIRKELGGKAKALRKKGILPGVLYGHKIKTIPLNVDYQDFARVFEKVGESTLLDLNIGQEKKKVLIHAFQKDPVSDKFIHVDFYQVRMDETIKAEVALKFIGFSPAVEDKAGVLVKNIEAIEIEALPKDLPHEIEIDLGKLKTFEDNIYIEDLKVPTGVKILMEPRTVIASVVQPRTKEEVEELEEKPEEKIEEVVGAERGLSGEEEKSKEEEKEKEQAKE